MAQTTPAQSFATISDEEREAIAEFYTSSTRRSPPGITRWEIRLDYPSIDSVVVDAPWLQISLRKPEDYMATMKKYCFDGMTEVDFRPRENKVSQFHSVVVLF